MATTTKANHWVQLDGSTAAEVTVTPPDGDRFSLTIEVATRGLKLANQLERFHRQVTILTEVLTEWITDHADDIDRAYLAPKDDGFLFLVVRRGVLYNDAVEDALTDLDVRVAQNPELDLIHLGVLALPDSGDDVVQSFLPRRGVWVYRDAERSDAHRPGQS